LKLAHPPRPTTERQCRSVPFVRLEAALLAHDRAPASAADVKTQVKRHWRTYAPTTMASITASLSATVVSLAGSVVLSAPSLLFHSQVHALAEVRLVEHGQSGLHHLRKELEHSDKTQVMSDAVFVTIKQVWTKLPPPTEGWDQLAFGSCA